MQGEGTGAALLADSLIRAGITTLFGVPGDTGVALYDALYHRRDAIRHVLARDERHAAVMADAYARCTNRVGVVEASSGGGTTYVVGGLGEPYASSVPVLVVTSDIHRGSRNSGALTEIDQTRLFSAVTKWSSTAAAAAEIPSLVSDALRAATTGRPGPVSLVVPEDVLDERTGASAAPSAVAVPRERPASVPYERPASVPYERPASVPYERPASVPYERPAADAAVVRMVAAALAGARQPAIVAGSGVHLSAAWTALQRLAEEAGIPVATSIHGKGAIAENSLWSLGVAGANGARDYANEYLAGADVVLFAGTRANATDTNAYTSPPRAGTTIIGLDIEHDRAGRTYPGSTALCGDARTVLLQLIDALPPLDQERRDRLSAWISERRRAWEVAAFGPREPEPVSAGAIHPRDVVRAVAAIAGDDAIVVADPGTPTPYVSAYWQAPGGARTVIVPRGHGPMGYAIPGAIGAAVARPGRPVVGLTADGSFAMSCGELETACRLALPIVYVQFTNGSLGWIKMLQHLYLDRRYFGVDLGPVDAAAVARGFGLEAARVATLDEFRDAFAAYHKTGRPAFIDVPVTDFAHTVPPVAPWHAALAGQGERPVY